MWTKLSYVQIMILAREINNIDAPPTFFILSRAISAPVITPMMFTWTFSPCPLLLSPPHLHAFPPAEVRVDSRVVHQQVHAGDAEILLALVEQPARRSGLLSVHPSGRPHLPNCSGWVTSQGTNVTLASPNWPRSSSRVTCVVFCLSSLGFHCIGPLARFSL